MQLIFLTFTGYRLTEINTTPAWVHKGKVVKTTFNVYVSRGESMGAHLARPPPPPPKIEKKRTFLA
jgi:hypothetical protein